LDRKQAIEFKLNFLQVQVQTGQLNADLYFEQLKGQIVWEKDIAKKLLQMGKKEDASVALQRAKIMEKELQDSQNDV